MEIFRGSWSDFSDTSDSAVTVGSFDGVHLGHRTILDGLVKAAEAQGLRSVALTFETHPRNVLQDSHKALQMMTTTEEKLQLLSEIGVQYAMVIRFDPALSKLSPQDFVQVVLKGRIGMKKMVIGYNHGFGKDRAGDRESLIAMSRALKFSVEVINPVEIGDMIVSSTILRNLLADGNVAKAAQGFGRYYSIKGVIVHGFGRGRRLHFPTANLGLIKIEKLIPRDGIYAGLATVRGETYPAAISIGFNPTFNEGKHSVEAHLINFDQDIYDEELVVSFVDRIRGEKKFSSEQELSAQIGQDVQVAADLLAAKGYVRCDT